MRLKRILQASIVMAFVAIMCSLMMQGCPGIQTAPEEELSSKDRAAVVAMELANYYEFVYYQAREVLEDGDEISKSIIIEKVTPTLNKVKPLLISYIRLVAMWQEGGVIVEGDMYEKEKQIRQQLQLLMFTIMNLQGD